MPRCARNIKNEVFYHVMIQGINKEYIFQKDSYKECYLSLLRRKLSDYNSILVAYCIMDNHAHFLFYSDGEGDLSTLLQRVNGSFSIFYNKNNNRIGYVFRDRFLSQAIFDDVPLMNCIKYIHNNPVKANMVKNAKEYKFSSYNAFEYCKSGLIDFNLVKRLINIEIVLENRNDLVIDDNVFIDSNEYDNDTFTNEYMKTVNLNMLKNNKGLLINEIKKCRFEMNLPVKVISNAFDIPEKTIYNWIKK